MSFLLLTDGSSKLLLEDGSSKLLLSAPDGVGSVTFPLIVIDASGTLPAWEGITFPLIQVQGIGTPGPIQYGDVTFPLLFVLGGTITNTGSVTFPLISVNGYGFVNLVAGSGLYQMIVGDTHDVYYDKVYNGSITSVVIPEPSAQTYLLHDDEENFIHIGSMRIRVIGSGNLKLLLYTMDLVRSQQLDDVILSTLTNREPAKLANLSARRLMLKLYTSNIDEKFDISRIIMFIKSIFSQKPN